MSGYFLYHSIGTYAAKEAELSAVLRDFASAWAAPGDSQWNAVLGLKQQFIESWARLIGARASQIALTANVTTGLYSIMGALPDEYLRGRTVLVAQDCFPSLHFLLQKLAGRFGFALRTVALRPGTAYVRDEDFIEAWDDSVGLALLTWVSSTTSHRIDLQSLTETAQRHHSLVALDITQGAGIVPFQVSDEIAFTLSASLKWVCGVPGACILHARADMLARCEPEYCGWFSQEDPFSWDLDRFRYASDARRFDNGTPSVLGGIGSLPGIRYVLDRGVAALRDQNLALGSIILDYAQARGWELLTPRAEAQRGGSLMLRAASAQAAGALVDALRGQKLYCDHRAAVLRLSPGNVTAEADVIRLCEVLKSAL